MHGNGLVMWETMAEFLEKKVDCLLRPSQGRYSLASKRARAMLTLHRGQTPDQRKVPAEQSWENQRAPVLEHPASMTKKRVELKRRGKRHLVVLRQRELKEERMQVATLLPRYALMPRGKAGA
jgi:hypothetical protein